MRFSLLPTIITLSSLGLVAARPEPSMIVSNLNTLSTKCKDLMPIANKLNLVNAAGLLTKSGPWATILEGFESILDIANFFSTDLAYSGPMDPRFTGADASYITTASGTYAAAQKQLLDTLASKGGPGPLSAAPLVGSRVRDRLTLAQATVDIVMMSIGEGLESELAEGVVADTETIRKAFKSAWDAFPY